MEVPGDEKANTIQMNAPSNASVISEQSEQGEPTMRKPRRFRELVRKHRRSIAEEAARTRPTAPPAYDQVILIPDAKATADDPGRRKSRHHHHDGEQESLWCRIKAGWRKVYHGLGLRHWAFIAVIAAYACLGGAIFSGLEKKHFEKESRETNITLAKERRELLDAIRNASATARTPRELEQTLYDLLEAYQDSKGLFPRTDIHWGFWDGVFYSYTLFTTIGYGHFVPTSHSGRIATIIYSLFGIPLLLAVLTDFGKLLTRGLKHVYSPVRHAVVHLWEMRHYKKMKARGEDICISHDETQQDMTQFDFPIPLALLMLVGWLFASACFFHLWETTWTYFDAFYFFYISLSTIGLGDLTPKHPRYMIASFPLILIGLTLVSLVINLIQNKIDQLKQKAQEMLEDQFGVDTVSASECDYDQEAGGGGGTHDAGTQPQPAPGASDQSKDRMGNLALGVIQSMNLKARRRRIGTQTDESYVRDVLRSEYGFERQSQQSLLSPDRARGSSKTRRRNKESDGISMSSGSAHYFDALSSDEVF